MTRKSRVLSRSGAGVPPGTRPTLGQGETWPQQPREDWAPLCTLCDLCQQNLLKENLRALPMNHLRGSFLGLSSQLQALPPPPVSLFHLPGKVPSPSQLSVTELPGDEVRLEWAAAAASGVLVYQIKWTPLGDGKAHEVWGGERRTPPPTSWAS